MKSLLLLPSVEISADAGASGDMESLEDDGMTKDGINVQSKSMTPAVMPS